MTAQNSFYTASQSVTSDPTRQRKIDSEDKQIKLEDLPDKNPGTSDSESPGVVGEKIGEHFSSLAIKDKVTPKDQR